MSTHCQHYAAVHLTQLFALKNGTRVTHTLGNVHANFVFFAPFVLELAAVLERWMMGKAHKYAA